MHALLLKHQGVIVLFGGAAPTKLATHSALLSMFVQFSVHEMSA